jgi:hypothetical protein
MHPQHSSHPIRRPSGQFTVSFCRNRINSTHAVKPVKSRRWPRTHLLNSVPVLAAAALLGAFTAAHAKDHVDLQFLDMIWGPPEYIDTGKALVAQFNQEHPDVTVTYRSIPWNNWYQTFLTAIGAPA